MTWSEVIINNSITLSLTAVSGLLLQTFDTFFLSRFIFMSHFISYIFLPLIVLILLEGFCLIAQEGFQSLFFKDAS